MQSLTTAILLPWMLFQGVASPPPPSLPALPDVLAGVSRNVKELQDTLPDFVCNEKVTSTKFRSGKQRDQKVVESLYSVQQWREHREILTIDGKPAKKGAKMPGLPINITGSFNYVIMVTFLPRFLPLYEFALKPKTGDAGRLIVEFETRKDQKELPWNIDGDILAAHDTGQVWIDATSMQVARLERNLLNITRDFSIWKNTIEQAPFSIGEEQYWLPKSFLVEITERDVRNSGSFLAEYTNCKKFTTEISIRVQ